MKKLLILLVLGIFTICPCPAQEHFDGRINIIPVDFAEKGDSLVLRFTIDVTEQALNKRQSLAIAPEVFVEGQSVLLPYVLVNGKQKARLYRRRIRFSNTRLLSNLPYCKTDIPRDTVLDYRISIPYEIWMDSASLKINHTLVSSAGKKQQFTTHAFPAVRLEEREPYVAQVRANRIEPEKEVKQRNRQGQAYLDFQAGRSVIIPDFRRNPEELARISETVNQIRNNRDVEIVGLYVEGYASPEGSYALNERLSRERSEALKNYMTDNFGLPAALFRVSSVAEDWAGLRVLVEQSTLPDKQRIMDIIDGTAAPDTKESQIKSLSSYGRMLNEMFPLLRRVEYQIDFTVKDYNVDESRTQAVENPEMLSHRELYLLASSYSGDSPERTKLFETIIRMYPDDNTALINYAAELLDRGEDISAKRYLDLAGDDTRSYNNLGVFHLKAGAMETAERYLRAALAAGVPEAEHNLEELEVKKADMEKSKRYER